MAKRLTDDELISLVEAEEANCISSQTGLLAEQRRKAMQYYYGQPYGDEQDGQSQVVTTEVKDAVEEILPALMKIFTSSDEIVRFDPQNKEDEEVASQATDYINYIFSRVNNGFQALYCLFKDALLQKNGYVKVYWEDYSDNSKETYEGLSDMEFLALSQDEELELVEHTETPDYETPPMIGPEGPVIPKRHDAVFRRTKKYGKICIDPAPPEEVLISRETPNDLKKARFVEHRTQKTISQVREMGFDVPDDIADFSSADYNMERVERLKFDDAVADQRDDAVDPATRKVWLCEAYLFVDFDGDGIAEYRKVTKIGKTLLDNVEFDSLPIVGGTAIMMPHKHYGLSVFDLVGDIQLIKSTITRQLLNNAYVANNGRMAVLDGMVNMEDLLTTRPNGVVRMKTLGALQRIEQPLLGNAFYGLLEYFDKVKQTRTGVVDFGEWTDPNLLNAKAGTAEIAKNATMQRIELMARILAEGPVKDIFWKIMELVSKHQQKPQVVRLRGKWTQVDPRQWHKKFDMTVTVGLGTGSQQTTLNGAMGIMQIQNGLIQLGQGGRVVNEHNLYAAARKYARAVFPRDADSMFTNPASLPPPQPAPNPEMLELQLKAHKVELQDAQKKMKMMFDAQLDQKDKQFQAWQAQFQAQVEAALKDKDHRSALVQTAVESEARGKEKIVDAVTQLKVAEQTSQQKTAEIILQGVVDRMSEMQQQNHERHVQTVDVMTKLAEAAMAEREIIRDAKGKAAGTRVKR